MEDVTAVAVVPDDFDTGYDIGTGLLGAVGRNLGEAKENRLRMIEKRILRIEKLLRRAGIEPEMIDLHEGFPPRR